MSPEPTGSPQQISAAIRRSATAPGAGARGDRARQGRGLREGQKLAKGAAIGAAAAIFAIFGLSILLNGFAWLAWWALPAGGTQFFWGFFLVAGLLFIVGGDRRVARLQAVQGRRTAHAGPRHRRGAEDQGDGLRLMSPAPRQIASGQRTPQEIRASIESNRMQLGEAIAQLRAEVTVATDWRRQIEAHKKQVLIGAAVAGFVIGGGLAIITRRRGNR